MSQSLNEITALAKRAARGAGLSWGMAEEAARAVRWLCSVDMDGPWALADLLEMNDGTGAVEHAPISLSGVWSAPSGRLCPLSCGAAISDCADKIGAGGVLRMTQVTHPMLIVPFAAAAAAQIGTPVQITWQDVCIRTNGTGLWLEGAAAAINQRGPCDVTCASTSFDFSTADLKHRAMVSAQVWARLTDFAERTYAPATEESRLLGAGAGTSDND